MNQRLNKFLVWNTLIGDFEDYHKTTIDKNGVLFLDENIKKANQDVFYVLPYIQKNDIHNQEIYQGHILRDTTGYFNTDIIVCYDEFSDSWTDQFETEPLQNTLLKGKFEIVGHVLTHKFETGGYIKDSEKLINVNIRTGQYLSNEETERLSKAINITKDIELKAFYGLGTQINFNDSKLVHINPKEIVLSKDGE